ncbi:thioredoxin-like protein [Chlamydoabsidia padenii]|nr:thioredoxin-like protein [Chlamydoabsidia padenii]
MRTLSLLIAGLTVLYSLVHGDSFTTGATEDEATNVLTLTEETFDAALTTHPLLLVKFYTPWCGYCKALAPEYEAAAEQMAESLTYNNTLLAQVDCSVYEELCIDHDINSFPTIKLFRDGIPTIYDGPRQTAALTRYLERQSMPALTRLDDTTQLEAFIRSDTVVVIGSGSGGSGDEDDTSEFYKVFHTLAEELRDRYLFGWLSSSSNDELVLYTRFGDDDGNKDIYVDDLNKPDSIKMFIRRHLTPVFGPIGPENYIDYEEAELPLAYLFVNSEPMLANLSGAVRTFAQQYRGQINFVYIDADAYPEQAEYLGINVTKASIWPAFVIQDPQSRRFILHTTTTADTIRNHLDQYLRNELVPHIESDPVPESNDGPVKVVVGSQFNELVTSSDRDVLLEVYAPWCGHCKALAPVWTRLGELVRDQNYPLVVAKMDGTSNDIPMDDPATFEVDGFPTIAFIEASTHQVALLDSDDRSLRALVDFIHRQKGNDTTHLELSDQDDGITGDDGAHDDSQDDGDGDDDDDDDDPPRNSQRHDEL